MKVHKWASNRSKVIQSTPSEERSPYHSTVGAKNELPRKIVATDNEAANFYCRMRRKTMLDFLKK